MIAILIFTNLLWFFLTSYLVWFVTGRPKLVSFKKREMKPDIEEATDEQINRVMKLGQTIASENPLNARYDINDIPPVEEREVE